MAYVMILLASLAILALISRTFFMESMASTKNLFLFGLPNSSPLSCIEDPLERAFYIDENNI